MADIRGASLIIKEVEVKERAGLTSKELEVKKGAGLTSKEVDVKKGAGLTSKEVEVKKVTANGPTSKQAFRKVEEEQRARLAKQRKAEEEWLQKLIQKEEHRRKRIQKIVSKEEQKTALRANADNKNVADAQCNLIKSQETAEQRHMRAEQTRRVKPVHRNQMLDRINEETECASPKRQGLTNGENQGPIEGK